MLFDKSVRDKAVKSACGKKKKAVKSSVKKFKVAASTGKVQYTKKPVTAADSYGWVVESWEAWDAYEAACNAWGKEYVDDEIIRGLSTDELAASLAYLFRMNDEDPYHTESDDEKDWDEYDFVLNDAEVGFDDFDEEVEYYREHKDELSEDDLYQIYEDANLLKKDDIAEEVNDFIEEKFYSDEVEESVRGKGRKSVTAAKRPVTAMRITKDFSEFQPWSGAVDTWNTLMDYDKLDLFEQILDTTFINNEGEGIMDETELNDLLWFEPETVYEWVGLYYNDETGEVSDEPFDTEDDEDED